MAQREADEAEARVVRARRTYNAQLAALKSAQAANPGAARRLKEQAHRAFQRANVTATSRADTEAAASAWLAEINRINSSTRVTEIRLEREQEAVESRAAELDRLTSEAEESRRTAESAAAACRSAREALAAIGGTTTASAARPGGSAGGLSEAQVAARISAPLPSRPIIRPTGFASLPVGQTGAPSNGAGPLAMRRTGDLPPPASSTLSSPLPPPRSGTASLQPARIASAGGPATAEPAPAPPPARDAEPAPAPPPAPEPMPAAAPEPDAPPAPRPAPAAPEPEASLPPPPEPVAPSHGPARRSPAPETVAPDSAADEAPAVNLFGPNPPLISRLVVGDRSALAELVERLAGPDPEARRRWGACLSAFVGAVVAAAIERSYFMFPRDHPFWSQFTREQARQVAHCLAALGFRYDGRGGIVDERVPVKRDLSVAAGEAGVPTVRIRYWPAPEEAAQLFRELAIDTTALLANEAPGITMGQLMRLLGRRASEMADLWNEWERVRPLLVSGRG